MIVEVAGNLVGEVVRVDLHHISYFCQEQAQFGFDVVLNHLAQLRGPGRKRTVAVFGLLSVGSVYLHKQLLLGLPNTHLALQVLFLAVKYIVEH